MKGNMVSWGWGGGRGKNNQTLNVYTLFLFFHFHFFPECYTANGADYRGTQNQTSQYAGKPCLFWNETFGHAYNTLKYPNGEGGLGEHNYCR